MYKVLLICAPNCALLLAAASLRPQSRSLGGPGTSVQAWFEDVAAHAGLTVRMVNGGIGSTGPPKGPRGVLWSGTKGPSSAGSGRIGRG